MVDVWQLIWLAVELDALDVDVGVAVVHCLNHELAALDGEFGTVEERRTEPVACAGGFYLVEAHG